MTKNNNDWEITITAPDGIIEVHFPYIKLEHGFIFGFDDEEKEVVTGIIQMKNVLVARRITND